MREWLNLFLFHVYWKNLYLIILSKKKNKKTCYFNYHKILVHLSKITSFSFLLELRLLLVYLFVNKFIWLDTHGSYHADKLGKLFLACLETERLIAWTVNFFRFIYLFDQEGYYKPIKCTYTYYWFERIQFSLLNSMFLFNIKSYPILLILKLTLVKTMPSFSWWVVWSNNE